MHGGYGYTREYPVEQFYRDNRLNPIHEGTNGIQALDLLGRKTVVDGGEGLRALGAALARDIERALGHDAELRQYAEALRRTWERLMAVTRLLTGGLRSDPTEALANAAVYLDAFGHTVVAWLWLRQALAAARGLSQGAEIDRDFYRGKLAAARYFFNWELPKTGPQLDLLERRDRTCLDTQPEWL